MEGKNALEKMRIEALIYEVRGQRVILDYQLAALYGVETKNLKRTVKANISRFPSDFMFELTKEEFEVLRCRNFTSKKEEVHAICHMLSHKRVSRCFLDY